MATDCECGVSRGLFIKALLFMLPPVFLVLHRYVFSVGNWLSLSVLTLVSLIAVVLLVFPKRHFRINEADIFLVVYCLYSLLRILLSERCYIEPLSAVKWILMFSLYLIGRQTGSRYIYILLLSVSISGVIAYPAHFFNNTGHLGAYVAIGLSGIFGLLAGSRRYSHRWLTYAVLSVLLLVFLVLSLSRGAVVAVAAALAYLLLTSKTFKGVSLRKKRLYVIVSNVVLVAGIILLYSLRSGSADVRLLIWSACGEAFLKSPIFGYSAGAVQSLYMPWQASYFQTHPMSSFAPLATNHYQTFNEPLHLLCEQGLVGFVLFSAFVFQCLRKCKSRGLNSALLASAVCSLFLYTYDISPIAMLVPVFLGMATTYSYVSTSEGRFACRFLDRPKTVHIMSLVIVSVSIAVCCAVAGRYDKAEHALAAFRALPQDSVAKRIAPTSEGVIFKNKDMSLLYATHSFRLSAADHVSVLEACARRIKVVEMMSALGNLYLEQDGMRNLAERCFLEAHYMTPDRMIPKYDLFKLYRDIGDSDKANEWAELILSSSPRTYNAITIEIKSKAREFMESIKK